MIYPNVVIYPHTRIGDDFTAHSNAVVREHCRLGDRVILQNGAVIGGDGFGFAPRGDGSYFKMVQSGVVILEDDVEVGANACVDRGTVGETRIGKGTKIDNLVQIGHGSTLGSHNILASQTGLAGTTTIGNHVTLAGQVGVAGHLKSRPGRGDGPDRHRAGRGPGKRRLRITGDGDHPLEAELHPDAPVPRAGEDGQAAAEGTGGTPKVADRTVAWSPTGLPFFNSTGQ